MHLSFQSLPGNDEQRLFRFCLYVPLRFAAVVHVSFAIYLLVIDKAALSDNAHHS